MTKNPLTVLRWIDAYIGRRLSIPLIIKFCQMTRLSKEAFISYAICVQGLLGILFWQFKNTGSTITFIFVCAVTTVWIILAAKKSFHSLNSPKHMLFYYRLLVYFLGIGYFFTSTVFEFSTVMRGVICLGTLFIFYAEDIDTIPSKLAEDQKP